MLSQRLLRAQIEIQSHYNWLRSFSKRTQIGNLTRTNARNFVQQHGKARVQAPLPATQKSIRARSSAAKRVRVQKSGSSYGAPLALREAIAELRIKDAANVYYALNDRTTLQSRDFLALAQCLHHCWRVERRAAELGKRRVQKEELIALAEELVNDVVKGKLAPNTRAHIHLLGFFKECGVLDAGLQFWSWLEGRDEMFVNADVYGAAIELLAANGVPLAELEELYQQALSRYPGAFAAYHLSPDAILADRDRATTLKGIPMSLLQGILTARLLHGDIHNAYLALDTALRLYPDQAPTRFFMLFLEERPLLEAYTVFALACRGGIVIPKNQFRHLLSALRTSSDLTTPARHALAVRAMLSALHMYIGVGGVVAQNMVSELVVSITQFLRLKGVAVLEAKKKQQLVGELMDIIRVSLAVFARYGATPSVSAFNSIITNLGGFGHSKQIIGVALSDAKALGIEPNEVTRRSILTAAGMLEDDDFVEKAWRQLKQARAEAQRYPDSTDWHCLLKAAHSSGHVEFARRDFEALKETLPIHDHYGILNGLEDSSLYHFSAESSEKNKLASLPREIKKIRADLQIIDERTKDRPKIQDFGDQQLPMTLLPMLSKCSLREAELKRIYDELTTEQQPSQLSQKLREEELKEVSKLEDADHSAEQAMSQPSITSTNLPFGTLRYENWKIVNWLLEQAEANDEAYHKLVDEAIAAGAVPPQRTLGLDLASVDAVDSFGLSNVNRPKRDRKRENSTNDAEIQKGREHILRLRGRDI